MNAKDIKRVLRDKTKLIYNGGEYVADSGIIKYINDEYQYCLSLIENYFDKGKSKSIVIARINDVSIAPDYNVGTRKECEL